MQATAQEECEEEEKALMIPSISLTKLMGCITSRVWDNLYPTLFVFKLTLHVACTYCFGALEEMPLILNHSSWGSVLVRRSHQVMASIAVYSVLIYQENSTLVTLWSADWCFPNACLSHVLRLGFNVLSFPSSCLEIWPVFPSCFLEIYFIKTSFLVTHQWPTTSWLLRYVNILG